MRQVVHRDGGPDKAPAAGPPRVAARFITALLQVSALRYPTKAKNEILNAVLESSSRQLEESTRNIEEIRSILHWTRTPRERTAFNIVPDDQKKGTKALGRLVDDLSEICNKPV
jgi:hypothetical protein